MSWKSGSETMVGATGFMLGIVAAVMAIILAYVHPGDLAAATLSLFSLSLGVFLLAAERFSEALEFENRLRHLHGIRLYNLGVVLMLWGLAILMLIFTYYPATVILIAFSLNWIRDVLRTLRPKSQKKQS